jgi:hypothetical protein
MLKLAANYGFPMVVSFYLLIRLEPLIKELKNSVTILGVVVARQSGVDYAEVRGLVEGGYR